MRILHICVCGPYTDGWSYQENMLAKYHVKSNNNVALLASQWCWGDNGRVIKQENTGYINQDGVKIYRLPIKGDRDVFYRYKRFIGFYDTITEFKPEIIFIHNLQFFDIKEVARYAKKHHVTVYADNHADFSNSAKSFVARMFYKTVWRHFAGVIEPYTKVFYGVTPARVDFLKKIYKLPEKKCDLLVMGADDDLVREALQESSVSDIRNKYGIKKTDFLIVTGGKIDQWKTQTLLLMKAVSEIKEKDIKLIIFGSVDDIIMDKLKQLCIDNKIMYIGWINSEEAYRFFAAAELVVFPGRHSVFWEQVAGLGKPLVCRYWEGTNHIDLGGNVKFLYKDNVEEIKNTVEKIYKDKVCYDEMKSIAIKCGISKFSYKNISETALK